MQKRTQSLPKKKLASSSKRMHENHMIDEKGQQLLKSVIPVFWRLREYKPDYGLDYSLELFGELKPGDSSVETLGEHVFIQLKTKTRLKSRRLKIQARSNVEKVVPQDNETIPVNGLSLDVVSVVLETEELLTVERMGSSSVVILVLVDLSTEGVYFVCLNDYIDKVLRVGTKDYAAKDSSTIYIPKSNDLRKLWGRFAFSWYAKRAKMYSAFLKAQYQLNELHFTEEDSDLLEMQALHFAKRLLTQDIFSVNESDPIANDLGSFHEIGARLRDFIESEDPFVLDGRSKFEVESDSITADCEKRFPGFLRRGSITGFWTRVSGLTSVYEEVWREFYLPTFIGVTAGHSKL